MPKGVWVRIPPSSQTFNSNIDEKINFYSHGYDM